jgi:hypothetical protein
VNSRRALGIALSIGHENAGDEFIILQSGDCADLLPIGSAQLGRGEKEKIDEEFLP